MFSSMKTASSISLRDSGLMRNYYDQQPQRRWSRFASVLIKKKSVSHIHCRLIACAPDHRDAAVDCQLRRIAPLASPRPRSTESTSPGISRFPTLTTLSLPDELLVPVAPATVCTEHVTTNSARQHQLRIHQSPALAQYRAEYSGCHRRRRSRSLPTSVKKHRHRLTDRTPPQYQPG
jgi:hypothetical protein